MRKIFFLLLLLLTVSSPLKGQQCHHFYGRTQNNLIPNVKFNLIPREVTEESAVSFLGEGGRRNFRFNGTFGILLNSKSRFKISGEYLQQKLRYRYSPGKVQRWVRQFATGATFQHDFCHPYILNGEFSGYCSYAPSRYLGREACGDFLYTRRIAGSTAYGFEAGSTFRLWNYATLTLDANYDAVIYHRRFQSNRHIEGFGGSFGFHQQLFDHFGLSIRAEFKRPYNYYRAAINWSHPCFKGLSVGIYGAHTKGKSRLPNNTVAGFELNYVFLDLFAPFSDTQGESKRYCRQELASWMAKPSVYMPEVFAISEERRASITPPVPPPIPPIPPVDIPTSTPIPDANFSNPGLYSLDVSSYFSSTLEALIFSADNLPLGSSIDPATGVITGTVFASSSPYLVTVTAQNSFGSTSQSFSIIFCSEVNSTPIPQFSTCVVGQYNYDISPYFINSSASNPLVFSATGLPPGAVINSSTGVISGANPQNSTTYNVTVTASNGCASDSQDFLISFTCQPPTSTQIPDSALPITPGTLYTFSTAQYFSDPCGNSITFSATGLPPEAVIDTATGIIHGVAQPSGVDYIVTVTGTTICGETSRTFRLLFTN
ncbi:Uncharacterized protein PHSC3_001170 [Chlamydiales bacterium STE3]|nr:Uncharacterized protein PHSC3_001170 [Chlamydiales bacterium STE3]